MKTICRALPYALTAALRFSGSNVGIMEVECRMASMISPAFGPVIFSLSERSSRAWRAAPLNDTPNTWPVVRNRYVIPVATARSSLVTLAIIAISVLVIRLAMPKP